MPTEATLSDANTPQLNPETDPLALFIYSGLFVKEDKSVGRPVTEVHAIDPVNAVVCDVPLLNKISPPLTVTGIVLLLTF